MKYTIPQSNYRPDIYLLQDSDGNILAHIKPAGSDLHQRSVIDLLQVALDNLNEGFSRGWHDGKREIIAVLPQSTIPG